MPKASEAQLRAQAKYDARETVQFKMKLNKKTDADVIQRLEEQPNKQGYVKRLIREDMRGS